MHIALESPDQPDVIALIAELDAYQDGLYPPESRHALDLAALTRTNVLFAVARDEAGRAVGCCAIVLGTGSGELKRMFVSPSARGQGLAQRLMARLEAEAVARGCRLLRLESGPFQLEALALYARCGYERCGPFGGYVDDPLSVFMEKPLEAKAAESSNVDAMNPAAPEFLRFTAPDAEAHARNISMLREKLEQALLAGDTLATVDHAADLGGLLTTARQEFEAVDLLRAHLGAAEAHPHAQATAWYWNAYATALQYTGRRSAAEPCFAKALDLCAAGGWLRLQAMVLHHWGRSLAEQQRFDEAEARIGEALALRVELQDPRQAGSRHALEALAELRAGQAAVVSPDAAPTVQPSGGS